MGSKLNEQDELPSIEVVASGGNAIYTTEVIDWRRVWVDDSGKHVVDRPLTGEEMLDDELPADVAKVQ